MSPLHLILTFDADLQALVHPALRADGPVTFTLTRRTSIKDLIESFRIPHTEVGSLLVNDVPADFSVIPADGDRIRIHAPIPPVDPCRPSLLRPLPLPALRFLVDVNVAKLGCLLRMAGFDCICLPGLQDTDIAQTASREGRMLLTRDRNLLKRKTVLHGRLVRSQHPAEQLAETLRLFGLQERIRPFSRCMKCNTLLLPVAKQEILHRLEPLTKRYYMTFFHCRGCDTIYWPGSHKTGMEAMLAQVLTSIA